MTSLKLNIFETKKLSKDFFSFDQSHNVLFSFEKRNFIFRKKYENGLELEDTRGNILLE